MELQKALLGAGCFWGVQYYFDQVPGVVRTTAGYSGGTVVRPTYEQVCSQQTGHAEVVLVEFDPTQVNYETLVRHFFRIHDPTLINSDGVNHGTNYRSALFYYNDDQKHIAKQIRDQIQRQLSKPIQTEIAPASAFYQAEAYHQKFAARTGRGICHVDYAPL